MAISMVLKRLTPTDNNLHAERAPIEKRMETQTSKQTVIRRATIGILSIALLPSFFALAQKASPQANAVPQKVVLPAGVERLCSIQFDKDERRPARVEDGALSCLEAVAKTLKQRPDKKLVLVGVSDPVKDHEEKDAGEEREGEDMTGLDIRYEDTAAYRAVNTKAYLTQFYGISPERILPTTNENRHGQDVTFYLVPGDADFLHNYLNTTRTNEHPCTVKPCYDPREESDTPQPRGRIRPQSTDQK